jgi:F-type H+-transporting ATPase subunit delta
MAERITLARPYAKAIFMLASETQNWQSWSDDLRLLADLVRHPDLEPLLHDPRVSSEQLLDLLQSLVGDRLGDQGMNLVRLLIQNKRLDLLPVIAEEYEMLRTEHEGVADVDVVAAAPLTQEQIDRLGNALAGRLGRKVRLHTRVDESLIGGFVIRTGDLVIDGSVKDRLSRLSSALIH